MWEVHTELPSEQRSRKHERLNFMPTEQKKDDRRPNAIGIFYASATSVLNVALYDNQKSNPVSVGCTNIGIAVQHFSPTVVNSWPFS